MNAMKTLKQNNNWTYLVYIISGRSKKTSVGIADDMNCLPFRSLRKFSRMVYYEKFSDRKKAMSKKRLLQKADKKKISKLVSENNPDWLNVIFTLTDETTYKLNLINK